MISIPTIAHSTTPIPASNLYRHESFLVISKQQVNDRAECPTKFRERQLYREVYGEVTDVLGHALTLFPTNPTQALAEVKQLHDYLKNISL